MTIFQLIRSEIAELDWKGDKWPIFFAFLGIAPAIGGIPPTANYFYVMLFLLFGWIIKERRSINMLCVIFLIACLISILVSMPPAFFKSWQRFGLFALVFMVAGPIAQSERIRKFRYTSLYTILKLCTIVSMISFVFYFLGINFVKFDGETLEVTQAGGFGGLTKNSMLLGPISMFGLVYTSYKALLTKSKLYWLAAIPCAACMMFSASRSAFVAGVVGFIAMVYVFSKSKGQFAKILISLTIVGSITYPVWNFAMNGLEEKQARNIDRGGTTSSRDGKWSRRMAEFNSNPATGVGFCACDVRHTVDYDYSTGTIEGGSSWFVVLSMTGLLGFIPFALLMYRCTKNTFKHKTNESALLIGLLSALLFHFIAESYIMAGGSQLCFMAWMTIGCCFDNIYNPTIS